MRKYLKDNDKEDAGVAERDGFEIRCTSDSTQGSNPCLPATQQ
jgi:hypothetical protein